MNERQKEYSEDINLSCDPDVLHQKFVGFPFSFVRYSQFLFDFVVFFLLLNRFN